MRVILTVDTDLSKEEVESRVLVLLIADPGTPARLAYDWGVRLEASAVEVVADE